MSQRPDPDDIVYQSLQAWPNPPIGQALRDLHALVFTHPEVTEAQLRERLDPQREALVLLAWAGEQLVGYKIGYARKQGHYYSWIGGVDPTWRGRGIASELMRRQHRWCLERGYKTIRTHTKNTWRSMLILNLRHDFDIVGTLTDDLGEPKLILEKKLGKDQPVI